MVTVVNGMATRFASYMSGNKGVVKANSDDFNKDGVKAFGTGFLLRADGHTYKVKVTTDKSGTEKYKVDSAWWSWGTKQKASALSKQLTNFNITRPHAEFLHDATRTTGKSTYDVAQKLFKDKVALIKVGDEEILMSVSDGKVTSTHRGKPNKALDQITKAYREHLAAVAKIKYEAIEAKVESQRNPVVRDDGYEKYEVEGDVDPKLSKAITEYGQIKDAKGEALANSIKSVDDVAAASLQAWFDKYGRLA